MNQCRHANPVKRERGPENGHPDRRPADHSGLFVLRGDDLALAGGVVRVLRPTLAGDCLWRSKSAASTSGLVGKGVGNREWGLRPQTPPPTEMGVLARD